MSKLSITYAGYTAGDSSAAAAQPLGPFHYETQGNDERFVFACDLLVTANDAAQLAAACAQLEAAYATWDAALVVAQLGNDPATTLLSHDPAAGTGFEMRPSFTKVAGAEDGPRSRRYRVRVVGRVPADHVLAAASGGVRLTTVRVDTGPTNRPRVTVRGRATASATASARNRYAHETTGAAARAEAWLTATLPGATAADYSLARESLSEDPEGTWLDFELVYDRRAVPDTLTTPDWAVASLQLQRRVTAADAANDPTRLATPAVRYAVDAEVEVNRDAFAPESLDALYRDTVRPALLAHLEASWLAGSEIPVAGGDVVLEEERVTLDTAGSRITLAWQVLAPAAQLVKLAVKKRLTRETRIEPRKLWDGRAHTYALYCPGDETRAQVVVEAERLHSAATVAPQDIAPARPGGSDSAGARWLLTATEEEHAIVAHGAAAADTSATPQPLHRTRTVFRFLLVADPGSASPVVVPQLTLV